MRARVSRVVRGRRDDTEKATPLFSEKARARAFLSPCARDSSFDGLVERLALAGTPVAEERGAALKRPGGGTIDDRIDALDAQRDELQKLRRMRDDDGVAFVPIRRDQAVFQTLAESLRTTQPGELGKVCDEREREPCRAPPRPFV